MKRRLSAISHRNPVVTSSQPLTSKQPKNGGASVAIASIVFVSQIVIQEAGSGDSEAIKRRLKAIEEITEIEVAPEVVALAQALVADGVVPETAAIDALRIAVATINGMDYLLTWNLKHIANAAMRNAISEACRQHGYEPPIICTPEELMEV